MGIVRQPQIKYDDLDPKARLLGAVGDISEYKPLNNRVLVATFKRADKTAGGIDVSEMVKEDEWQSKIGLIIAVGPTAFDNSDGKWFQGVQPKVGEWVCFRPSNGQSMDVNKWPCRIFPDTQIDMIVPSPNSVW